MTSTSRNSSTCSSSGARRHRHHKRRFATTVCAGVLALAASAILLASNDGLYTSTEGGHRQLKTSAGGKNHRASSKQEAAATGENKRRQLAKDDDYVKIGDRRLAAAGVDEKRRLLDDGLGEKQPIFRLESLIGTLFGSEEAGWAKRKLADRIVKSPRTLTEETGNNRYNPLRKLSLYLLGNGCLITPAQALPRERQIETSVVASYPGSGAKMTWKLIEALTGIVTGDEHHLNGHQWDRTASVKSHFPHEHGSNEMGLTTNELFPRAILLLRHPKDSIPSFFNFLYEVEHNLPGHSTRAPAEEWIKWRDSNFDEQMVVWAQHADYWLSRYSDDPEKILVLGFEGMTDDRGGPASALGLAAFLDRSAGIDTIDPEAVPCIWDKIVRYKEGEKDTTTPPTVGRLVFQTGEEQGVASKRAAGDGNDRPYTEQQLEKMLGLLREVHKKHKSNKQLVQWLRSYETVTEGLQRKLWLAQMGCPETGCPPGHVYPTQPLDIVPSTTPMYNAATQEVTMVASTTTVNTEEAAPSTVAAETMLSVQSEPITSSVPVEPSSVVEEAPVDILQATGTVTSTEQIIEAPPLPVADPEAADLMHTVEQIDEQIQAEAQSVSAPLVASPVAPAVQAVQAESMQQEALNPIQVASPQDAEVAVAVQSAVEQPRPEPQPQQVLQQVPQQLS